jgi:glucosamine-6-phosphate deaminase
MLTRSTLNGGSNNILSTSESINPVSLLCERLKVEIYRDKETAGIAGAAIAAEEIRSMLAHKRQASVIFASAVSQDSFLTALRAHNDIEWNRITVFHLDEYAGMSPDHPASFRRYLRERLLDHVPVRAFHQLNGEAKDLGMECKRYSALLGDAQPGLVALGIGENGHLAFIDPQSCNFNDPEDVRAVDLDDVCRMQQVHDGAFAHLDDVPRAALSLTVPLILRIPRALIFVSGEKKAMAVKAALGGPLSETCPASALRQHPNANMFLDQAAAARLDSDPV